MSQTSLGSVDGPGWSCTLTEGVTRAANIAGMTIQPEQVAEVWITSYNSVLSSRVKRLIYKK